MNRFKVTLRKLAAAALTAGLAFSGMPAISAAADSSSEKVVTLGVDLSASQRDAVLRYFGIQGKNVKTIYVNNLEERALLGGSVPLSQIGSHTYSCAYVQPTSSGGIHVKTANLNWVTSNMIAGALSTAGVSNCNVIAACPFPVSGTGALTGILKAYDAATGRPVSDGGRQAAVREIYYAGRLADYIGQVNATMIINNIKYIIIEDQISPRDLRAIRRIVREEIQRFLREHEQIGIEFESGDFSSINPADLDGLAEVIAAQELDIGDVQETLDRIDDNMNAITAEAGLDGGLAGDTAPDGGGSIGDGGAGLDEPVLPGADDTDDVIPGEELVLGNDNILLGTDDAAFGADVILDATDEAALPDQEFYQSVYDTEESHEASPAEGFDGEADFGVITGSDDDNEPVGAETEEPEDFGEWWNDDQPDPAQGGMFDDLIVTDPSDDAADEGLDDGQAGWDGFDFGEDTNDDAGDTDEGLDDGQTGWDGFDFGGDTNDDAGDTDEGLDDGQTGWDGFDFGEDTNEDAGNTDEGLDDGQTGWDGFDFGEDTNEDAGNTDEGLDDGQAGWDGFDFGEDTNEDAGNTDEGLDDGQTGWDSFDFGDDTNDGAADDDFGDTGNADDAGDAFDGADGWDSFDFGEDENHDAGAADDGFDDFGDTGDADDAGDAFDGVDGWDSFDFGEDENHDAGAADDGFDDFGDAGDADDAGDAFDGGADDWDDFDFGGDTNDGAADDDFDDFGDAGDADDADDALDGGQDGWDDFDFGGDTNDGAADDDFDNFGDAGNADGADGDFGGVVDGILDGADDFGGSAEWEDPSFGADGASKDHSLSGFTSSLFDDWSPEYEENAVSTDVWKYTVSGYQLEGMAGKAVWTLTGGDAVRVTWTASETVDPAGFVDLINQKAGASETYSDETAEYRWAGVFGGDLILRCDPAAESVTVIFRWSDGEGPSYDQDGEVTEVTGTK